MLVRQLAMQQTWLWLSRVSMALLQLCGVSQWGGFTQRHSLHDNLALIFLKLSFYLAGLKQDHGTSLAFNSVSNSNLDVMY